MAKHIHKQMNGNVEVFPACIAAVGAIGLMAMDNESLKDALIWANVAEHLSQFWLTCTPKELAQWADHFQSLLKESGIDAEWEITEVEE